MHASAVRIFLVLVALAFATPVLAQSGVPIGGGSMSGPPEFVPFGPEGWDFTLPIIFDPNNPSLEKHFESPRDPTGGPILLDANQPVFFPVWEFFPLGIDSFPISDWHEHILTPGWEWGPNVDVTLNGDPTFPESVDNMGTDLWLFFPPVHYPDTLDIHKDLVWVGTPTNPIWGDDPTGESFIRVVEIPTPEPGSIVLAALGFLGLIGLAWLRRGKR